jgi:hypothetical protein
MRAIMTKTEQMSIAHAIPCTSVAISAPVKLATASTKPDVTVMLSDERNCNNHKPPNQNAPPHIFGHLLTRHPLVSLLKLDDRTSACSQPEDSNLGISYPHKAVQHYLNLRLPKLLSVA